VCFNGVISSPQNITNGVPQGSLVGPLLFIFCVNDMQRLHQRFSILMYAKIQLLLHGVQLLTTLKMCSFEFDNILFWIQSNSLIIHPTKTECILFGTHQRYARAPIFTITIGTKTVKQVCTCKYPSINLDSGLTFEEHVSEMANKVSQRLEALGRLRPYLTSSAANTIYKAFILPILDYCDIYWKSVGSTLAEKLERLQKRAARVVLREGSSNDPVLQLAWTKLLIRRQQHLCTFIFKRLQGFVGTELFFHCTASQL